MRSNLLRIRAHSGSYEYSSKTRNHSKIVLGDGEVFSWGLGEYGALGTGRRNNQWSPIQIFLDEKTPLGAIRISAGGRHTGFISGISPDLMKE